MATATFTIPQNHIGKLNSSLSAVGEMLNEVSRTSSNAKVICDALVAFHDDGSPIVNGFEIDEVTYDADSNTGKVRFSYVVNYTFGCSDLSPVEKATERCDFDIDLDNAKLQIHIHNPLRRDTFDEF